MYEDFSVDKIFLQVLKPSWLDAVNTVTSLPHWLKARYVLCKPMYKTILQVFLSLINGNNSRNQRVPSKSKVLFLQKCYTPYYRQGPDRNKAQPEITKNTKTSCGSVPTTR